MLHRVVVVEAEKVLSQGGMGSPRVVGPGEYMHGTPHGCFPDRGPLGVGTVKCRGSIPSHCIPVVGIQSEGELYAKLTVSNRPIVGTEQSRSTS
jgi:hypothetical protein